LNSIFDIISPYSPFLAEDPRLSRKPTCPRQVACARRASAYLPADGGPKNAVRQSAAVAGMVYTAGAKPLRGQFRGPGLRVNWIIVESSPFDLETKPWISTVEARHSAPYRTDFPIARECMRHDTHKLCSG
jgi:hypothetical protein